jgi:hypothetical protein
MVTRVILERTIFIKYQIYTGSAFTFERNEIQYLATARHLFPFIENHEKVTFSIKWKNEWHEIPSRIHKHPNDLVDIVILELPQDLSPRREMKLSAADVFLSQDAFFVGFPLGRYMEDANFINDGYPLPYVKKGIFSALMFNVVPHIMYLDGINNPGFSGGPCVYRLQDEKIPTICGVVKGYVPHQIEVKTPFGSYPFTENSGLVEVHSISHLDEIEV